MGQPRYIYCSIYIGAMEMEVLYKDIIDKPDYKIYQMTIDPDAFKLKEELIND